MAPVAHWTPADYYIAVGRARAAWERSQPQLVLGLEGADAGTTSLVASAPSSPPSPHADGTHSEAPPRVGEGGLDFKRVWYKGRWVCPECEETDGHLPDCSYANTTRET